MKASAPCSNVWCSGTGTALSIFDRPHHQRIAKALAAFDTDLLAQAHCYFAGDTAIVLQLDEYRESVDIDFLCADPAGYRLLRETVTSHTLGRLLRTPLPYARDIRTQRDKISTYLSIDNTPVRVEFALEGRIPINGQQHPQLAVPVLDRSDMYAEKLLANADRALDRSQRSRDLIDLAFMIHGWGPFPRLRSRRQPTPTATRSGATSNWASPCCRNGAASTPACLPCPSIPNMPT
ncbi:MAG: nucleotidyl transferase AbiEii/AbiGii toxin family protein [Luteimonas sp.]